MRRRAGSGGFTVIELMMAIVVLLTAAFGILAFERAIIRSNSGADDLTAATYLTDYWLENLRAESSLWRTDQADVADSARTPMMAAVTPAIYNIAGGTTDWLDVPPADASPRYNRHLEPWTTASPASVDLGEFCSQYRLTVLVPNELLRAEARVLWYKADAARTGVTGRAANWDQCPPDDFFDTNGFPDREMVHVIQAATTLWRNTAP